MAGYTAPHYVKLSLRVSSRRLRSHPETSLSPRTWDGNGIHASVLLLGLLLCSKRFKRLPGLFLLLLQMLRVLHFIIWSERFHGLRRRPDYEVKHAEHLEKKKEKSRKTL